MAETTKPPYNTQSVESLTTNYFNSTTTLVKNGAESGKESFEEYDPYANRDVAHPNSFMGAFLHIVKISLGTGILAVPRAFKNAGLLVGFIGTIFVGIMCTHAVHILVKASQKICRKTKTPSLGFAETAEGVFNHGPVRLRKFSTFAKYFVEGGLFSIHFLANSVYLVFISISLIKLFSGHYPEVANWPDYAFKLIILIPLLICGQVRELKHLVPFSLIANVSLLVTFGTTGYYMFNGLGDIDIKDRKLAGHISGIPSFFSTVLFSMEGIGTIMPLENSMMEPKFIGCPSVLNCGMAVVITIYTVIGFLGYLKWGESTEATITANLPTGEIPAEIAQAAIIITVFFSFMLVFYVPVDIIWSRLKTRIPESRWNVSQILLRSFLICLATGIAIAGGENLGLLIDLVGAVFLSTLGLFVPAVIDILADWDDGWGVFHWRLIKNLIMMLLAVFGLISGLFYSIEDLVKK